MTGVWLTGSVAGLPDSLDLKCRPRHLSSSIRSNGMVPVFMTVAL
jgi:hypothetical protein